MTYLQTPVIISGMGDIFFKKSLILAGMSLILANHDSLGRTRIDLRPVKIQKSFQKEITVHGMLPCSSSYLGVFVREISKKKVELALAAKISRKACVSLPAKHSVTLKYIDLSKYQQFATIKHGYPPDRYSIHPPVEIIDRRFLTYQQSCGKSTSGLVVREVGTFVSTALLQLKTRKSKKKCSTLKRRQLPSIQKGISVGPLHLHQPKLESQYLLKLAPVNPQSLITDHKGYLELSYQRRCNEVPIGIVITEKQRVGMLVGQFFNLKCRMTQPYSSSTTYSISSGRPFQTQPRLLSSLKSQRLNLVQPNSVSPNRDSNADFFQVTYFDNCEKEIGLVLSSHQWKRNLLSVGILTGNNKKCLSPASIKTKKSRWSMRKELTLGPLRLSVY